MNGQRSQSSNVGLRRRRPPSGAESTPREDISRTLKSRLEGRKHAELIRNYGSLKPTARGTKRDESDRGDHQHDDCDSGSSLVLLNNPALDVLPVERTEQARGALDFYVNSYVSSVIEVSPANVALYSNFVHQILHDELLFTAFTTCSEAARWRTKSLHGDPPLGVRKGYGKTVSLLSERLQTTLFAMTPAILLTMSQLVAIETMTKNVSATARHLAGMQAAMKPNNDMAPRKGSASVLTATDIWTQYFVQRAKIRGSIPKSGPLVYPKHPFNAKISMQVADLPAGFCDLALSERLSIEMLDVLEGFNSYFTKLLQLNQEGILDSPERTQVILRQAAYCIEYHQVQQLSTIERLVLTALTAYVVRRDRVHPALINIRNFFQITCGYQVNLLSSAPISVYQQDQDGDLLLWVGVTLLLTSTPEAHARKLALKLLPKKPEPVQILKECQRFFWDDDLTNALLSGGILVTNESNDITADNIELAPPGNKD